MIALIRSFRSSLDIFLGVGGYIITCLKECGSLFRRGESQDLRPLSKSF